jgi:hypothetical protein
MNSNNIFLIFINNDSPFEMRWKKPFVVAICYGIGLIHSKRFDSEQEKTVFTPMKR